MLNCGLSKTRSLLVTSLGQVIAESWVLQSNKGAKNHGVILPDAYKEATTSALVGAAFGAAGQRCMALSTAVFVGGIEPWQQQLIEKASKLKVGPGYKEGIDVGPLISPEARQRCIDLINSAEQEVCTSVCFLLHCRIPQ